jgi:hypothetical protein
VNDTSLPLSQHERDVLTWCQLAVEEGEAFLKSCPGYHDFDPTIKAIMGEPDNPTQPLGVQAPTLNHFGKVALDMTAALTDIKPFWDYRTSNERFNDQSQMANKLSLSWWVRRSIDLKHSDVVKYALAMGTGYAHSVFNPDIEDLDVIPEDPRDVIPIRPASFITIQDSMGVMIRRERTVNYLRARWPLKASQIKPDRDGSHAQQPRVQQLLSQMQSAFMSNLFASLGGRPKQQMNIPTTDEFTLYVKDDSKNETGETVWMGLGPDGRERNWSYQVKPGEKLYPRKRCIIFTRTAVLYDDTSIYWHGMFPLNKLTLDPWPWAWLGKAPLKDLLPLQREVDRLMRVIAQHHRRIQRPGIAGDKNAIGERALNKIDPEREGLRIAYRSLGGGKPLEMLYEPPLDQSVGAERQFLIDMMDSLAGRVELKQLMNLGQVPTTETIDRIMETMPASNRLRSRVMEVFIRDFAMMTLSNFFQFYTLPQRVAVLGTSGMTFEDFDFDPGSMIPDMIDMLGKSDDGNPLPRDQRAREFLRYFTFNVAPGSLLASASVTDKLLYVQLFRMGAIDLVTLLQKLNIPGIGMDTTGSTIIERLMKQQEMGIGQTVSAAGRKSSGQQQPRLKISESG